MGFMQVKSELIICLLSVSELVADGILRAKLHIFPVCGGLVRIKETNTKVWF